MTAHKGYIDIEWEAIEEAHDRILKKKDVCKILPRARFSITEQGEIVVSSLVCDDRMGGKQTGVAAEHCENCIKKID